MVLQCSSIHLQGNIELWKDHVITHNDCWQYLKMNISPKHTTNEWIIAVSLSLGCGYFLFGGLLHGDTYMMVLGTISAPIITVFLHKGFKQKTVQTERKPILWALMTILPLLFLGSFFIICLGLNLLVKFFFVHGLN